MKALKNLPEAYSLIYEVNLQKNKKMAAAVNLAAAAVMILMAAAALPFVSIRTLFNVEKGLLFYLLKLVILIVSMIAYIILHEAVHGMAMRLSGTEKIRFGFTGMYAFAGSDEYYGKKNYLLIALAPVALFGLLFGVLTLLVPREWFWVVYILQICNVSGAMGDLFVTLRFMRLPKDILVRDSGVEMLVYSKENH